MRRPGTDSVEELPQSGELRQSRGDGEYRHHHENASIAGVKIVMVCHRPSNHKAQQHQHDHVSELRKEDQHCASSKKKPRFVAGGLKKFAKTRHAASVPVVQEKLRTDRHLLGNK